MKKLLFSVAICAFSLATPVWAKPVDNYVATLIENADYSAAESALTAQLARSHDNQNALLNLAFVYRQTGRDREADALYAHVLSCADVRIKTAGGQILSAHAIASAARTGTVTVAAR